MHSVLFQMLISCHTYFVFSTLGLKEQLSVGYLELSEDLGQRLPVSSLLMFYLRQLFRCVL